MMQHDGNSVKAMYRFKSDPMLWHNVKGQVPEQDAMERQLKALIQQYINRMNGNHLTVE